MQGNLNESVLSIQEDQIQEILHPTNNGFQKLGKTLSQTPVQDIFPNFFRFLHFFGCCKSRVPFKSLQTDYSSLIDENGSNEVSINARNEVIEANAQEQVNYSPINELRQGFQIYSQATHSIFALFIILGFFFAAVIMKAYSQIQSIESISGPLQLTNLALSYPVAVQQFVGIQEPRILTCASGQIQTLNTFDGSGLIPYNETVAPGTYETTNQIFQYENATFATFANTTTCTKDFLLTQNKMYTAFQTDCHLKSSCAFNLTSFVTPNPSNNCTQDLARVFIQYMCYFPENLVSVNLGSLGPIKTQLHVAVFASAGLIVTFYIGCIVIWYFMDQKQFEFYSNTANPENFTLKSEVTETLWQNSLQTYDGTISKHQHFIQQLESEIPLQIDASINQNIVDLSGHDINQDYKVACIFLDNKLEERPTEVYVTFQCFIGLKKALEMFGKDSKRVNTGIITDDLKFVKAEKPKQINRENRLKFSFQRVVIQFLVSVVIIAGFLVICSLLIQIMVDFLQETANLVFQFGDQCSTIDSQFKGNQTTYATWAALDKQFLRVPSSIYKTTGGMTGVYQCYCTKYSDQICKEFNWNYLQGGKYSGLVFGIVIGILNTIGITLVQFLASKIGFHNRQRQSQFIILFGFIVLCINTSLLGIYMNLTKQSYNYLFNLHFLQKIEKLVFTAIFSTIIFLYAGVAIDICFNIRKKERSEHNFPVETRYVYILSTITTVFFYGFTFPSLFFYILIPLLFFSVVDTLLVVYWYKAVPFYDDLQIISFQRLLKFAPVFMVYSVGKILSVNNNLNENFEEVIYYFQLFQIGLHGYEYVFYWYICQMIAPAILENLVMIDIYQVIFSGSKFQFKDQGDKHYINQLSEFQRNQWIAQEELQRSLGIKMTSDDMLDQLANAKCAKKHLIQVTEQCPYNYEVLVNPKDSLELNYEQNDSEENNNILKTVYSKFI